MNTHEHIQRTYPSHHRQTLMSKLEHENDLAASRSLMMGCAFTLMLAGFIFAVVCSIVALHKYGVI